MQSLEELRKKIDNIDTEIINLLSKRKDAVKEVAAIKKELGKAVFDKEREQQLLEKIKVKARGKNLDEKFVQSIYNIILKSSKEEQEKIVER